MRRAASRSYRVFRGGGWLIDLLFARVADRNYDDPGCRNCYLGLRLARRVS